MPLQFTENNSSAARLNFNANNRARMASVIAVDWDHLIGDLNRLTITSTSSETSGTSNSSSYLEILNTNTTQYTGAEIRLGIESATPMFKIKSELITGPSPYKGNLVFYARDENDALTQLLQIGYGGQIFSGNIANDFGGQYSFGAVNKHGDQAFIGLSKTSDLTGLGTGEYVGTTTGLYGTAVQDYVGVGNPGAWGGYLDCLVTNDLFAVGAEIDVQNQSGTAARSIDPNNPFGTDNTKPLAVSIWSQPQGHTIATSYDVSAFMGIVYNSDNGGPKYLKGWNVGVNSIQSVGGNIELISAPANYQIAWYDSGGTDISRLYGTGTAIVGVSNSLQLQAANSTAVSFNLGFGATGNRSATINFGASSTGGGADAAIVRASGANGTLSIQNVGTGTFAISTNGTNGYFLDSSQNSYFPTYGNGALYISGGSGQISSGILAGAYGGTNNGFMDFTGPTTSLKTFTLPNASATILTTNAAVTVAQGGTGATSLTSDAILTGNGTSAIQAEASWSISGTVLTGTTVDAYAPALVVENSSNGVSGGYVNYKKYRAGAANNGAAQVGDTLGTFLWQGKDQSGNYQNAAFIDSAVTSVGASSVVANIRFAIAGSTTFSLEPTYASFVNPLINASYTASTELRATSDVGGAASQTSITNTADVSANSTGVGSIKFKGATSRDSTGFIKIYVGTTAYYVPVFSAITG